MKLMEIRDSARKYFGTDDVDILDMLVVLFGDEKNHDVDFIFNETGITKQRLHELVKEFQALGNTMPQSLLTSSICRKGTEAYTDVDLVRFVFLEEDKFQQFIKKECSDIGVIIENLKQAEKETEPEKDNYLQQAEIIGENMTKKARDGKFDYLFGREDELAAIESVLLRKDKANVILTGSAGVGKTALVELLVRESTKNPNSHLKEYVFCRVDITELLSATAYRGELERKLSNILKAAAREKNVVIFIDEIHRINQSADGRSEGSQVAEILKPYLSRDNLRVIGATTTKEYQKYIARNESLFRRFQQIKVKELSGEKLFKVIKQYCMSLEKYHHVKITDDIIRQTIALTDEYIKTRYQPDKSNEILDSACVCAVKSGLREIDNTHLVKILSETTDIPTHIINKKMTRSSLLIDKIKTKVFGQDEQVERVANTIRVKMAGFKNNEAPLASFMFAGDSGVGKTYLARILAKEILEDENALTVIDMAEFSESHSVSKLVGSPPGYVNSDDEGMLTRALSESAYNIIVFDEIEKAASEIYKLLLGMMDTGKLTSGIGNIYDASNSVLIFTTNAVTTKKINKQAIGFSADTDTGRHVLDGLRESFPVEFLGRLDEVIMFNHLTDDDYKKIIRFNLAELISKFEKRGVVFEGGIEGVTSHILNNIAYRELGVRGVLDLIRNKMTAPIVELMAASESDAIVIKLDGLLSR